MASARLARLRHALHSHPLAGTPLCHKHTCTLTPSADRKGAARKAGEVHAHARDPKPRGLPVDVGYHACTACVITQIADSRGRFGECCR
jgi:hypothetical protein